MSASPGQDKPGPPPRHQCLGCDYGDSVDERIEKGNKAFSLGEYDLSAEIFHLIVSQVTHPDRTLCLQMGNALARAGRIVEAVGAFRGAAQLGALGPQHLKHLAWGLAHVVRVQEWCLPALYPACEASLQPDGSQPAHTPAPLPASATPRDLLSCPVCRRLLDKPVTLLCGRTVCKRCVRPGPTSPRPRRVCEVLGDVLEKWFPGEGRVRWLAGQARSLQRQQQYEAALARCQQALELVPSDIALLLFRAELHLSMKNYELTLQDTNAICQKEPYYVKGHEVQAHALHGLGRIREMLKELLYCLAINPDLNSVRKEAQKVIYELFFQDSDNAYENIAPSTLSEMFNIRLTLQSSSSIKTRSSVEEENNAGSSKNPCKKSYVFRDLNSAVKYFLMGLHFKEDRKIVDSVLDVKPNTALKRPLSNDPVVVHDWNMLRNIWKKDSLSQRSMGSNIGGSSGYSLDLIDFACFLCRRLLFEPVTTPCGHTFCLKCIQCCLDYISLCPVCKETLSEFLASRNFNITTLAEELIVRYLPDELSERKRIDIKEMSQLPNISRNVPIFACAIAFPSVTCPLRVYGVRYRPMIRRCMEAGINRFGMCLPTENSGISLYGCMLEIKDLRTFADRTSIVDAVGISRFRVIRHCRKSGFNTADVEYLEDIKVEGPEYEELATLHDSVYQQSVSWFAALQDDIKEKISSHFGLMPERESEPQSNVTGPAWSWWVLAVLPLEHTTQLAVLSMTSLKERLRIIQRILVLATHKMNSEKSANAN